MKATKSNNCIKVGSLFRGTFLALFLAGAGLQIVYLKNQQFQLGQKIRHIEQAIHETHLSNQILLTQIAQLSSRAAIQKKLLEHSLVMIPIEDRHITRLSVPGIIEEDEMFLRTASHEMKGFRL